MRRIDCRTDSGRLRLGGPGTSGNPSANSLGTSLRVLDTLGYATSHSMMTGSDMAPPCGWDAGGRRLDPEGIDLRSARGGGWRGVLRMAYLVTHDSTLS